MSSDKVFEYPGEKETVRWDGRLCIHIGECGRAANDLFEAGRKPWCKPDLAGVDDVAEVVIRCPTGALTWVGADDSVATETAADRNTIHVANNGPLYVKGDLEVDGAGEDMDGVRFRAALCRCGQSKNKPFCDNSHETAGFVDRGAVGTMEVGGDPGAGKLAIKRAPNGPLLVSGPFTLHAGSGRVAHQGEKAALCRCGASKNKPYCDGSHKAEGFEAD